MINLLLTSWVPLWGQIFKKKFSSLFYPVTLNLAYFAFLNGAGWTFPVNFNYQRCLETSNMINFWLTSWVPSWGQICLVCNFFTFLPVTLNLPYFAPLNGAGWIFPVNFNYQRCLKSSSMINIWLTSWVSSWGQIFLKVFFHFFTRHFEFSLPLNGADRIFPVNFNYQRCLENSYMICFWLTSWVPSLGQIFFSFFYFLPRTRVGSKQPLINARPKHYFDNPVTFLETRGKN